MRILFKFLIALFATIGFLSVLAGISYWLIDESLFRKVDEPIILRSLLSPDGEHKALRVVNTGGGAAGWCSEFVLIRSSESQRGIPTYHEASEELVFSTSCSTNQYKIHWSESNQLAITFQLNNYESTYVEMRSKNSTGNVSVRFESEAQ